MKISIIDYSVGNIQSVIGAIEKLGHEAILTNNEKILRDSNAIILPGVGAFSDGMNNLKKYDLVNILNRLVIKEKKPILGICLGMHLFAKKGHEFGLHDGLGWIDGEIRKLDLSNNYKIPHVGWNDIEIINDNKILKNIESKLFYFVHSYYFDVKHSENVIANCNYDKEFAVMVNKNNIYGVQFHPEKSQKEGLSLINNFIQECSSA